MGTNETIDQAGCHIADSTNIAAIHTLLIEHGFTTESGPVWPGFIKGDTQHYYHDAEQVFVVDIHEYGTHPHLWKPSKWMDVQLVKRLMNGGLGSNTGAAVTASLMTSEQMLAFLRTMYGAQ